MADEQSFWDTNYGGLNPKQWAALGTAGGSLLFGGGGGGAKFQNPADAGMGYLNEIPGEVRKQYNPYIQRGNRASNALEDEYGNMTQNTGGFLNSIGQNYQESPGYQWRLQQALQAGNNTAAAGGLLGSQANQAGNAGIAAGLAGEDYDKWLNHALDIFGMGQKGYQGLNEQGFNASGDYANALGQTSLAKAGLATSSVDTQNKYNQAQAKNKTGFWDNLSGAAISALPFLATI